ncbi:cAMP-binding domain of CRP or a regulatory subunit of cAMP-dependent protein kinases [bacterium A37T11]|nr:cAMP-binding domain of CRP or a regulatory subunit of cAMP-dependent protein kinases [bacterium A37T11]
MQNDPFYPEFLSRMHALCQLVPGFREVFASMLDRFELNPKEYLFRKGQLLTHHYWQMSGYSLGYQTHERGHKKVIRVMEKGSWLINCLEIKVGLRAAYNLVAVVPSVLYGMSPANLKLLCDQFWQANLLLQEFQRQEISYLKERLWILSVRNRKEKMQFFRDTYSKGLFHSLTNEELASYLDMSRQYLPDVD